MVMAGADVAILCSVLLRRGIDHIKAIEREMKDWLVEHAYDSLEQMKGSMSQKNCPEPLGIYRKRTINSLTRPMGVWCERSQMAKLQRGKVHAMNAKRTYTTGDVMVLDADRYGHPLRFRPEKLQRIEHNDRASVLSADKYGHVCRAISTGTKY
jgi:hypothetical protein